MLTKALLEFRTRKGRIYPQFIREKGREDALAEALVGRLCDGVGESRGTLVADLTAQANGHARPRIAKGLVKLLLDRAEFEEPHPDAQAERHSLLAEADAVRAALPEAASFEAYEQALEAAMEKTLADVRARLYADLPDRRPLVGFKPITAEGLIARYDLAQVQGLLLHSQRLAVRTDGGDTPELRRVLRWMRFCRLVADIHVDDGWSMVIEGPAAVLDSAKKYGLQLAMFFLAVPTLERWAIEAEITLPRRSAAQLELSQEAGLLPGLDGGAGHVPPELTAIVDRWRDPDWTLDLNPAPRAVGVQGWCVPDLAARRGEREVAIELFHRWHSGPLARRIEALATRPVDGLLLGVDRHLARGDADLTTPNTFEFNGMLTERGLKRALADWWATHGR